MPTPESAQQLLDDQGLSVNELKYDSSDGRSYSWNEYLGDLIFQVTMVGSLSITHVEAEIEMVDRKLQAVSQRYPHRQLCAIIDIGQGFNLDRQARGVAINQWIKWGKDPNFGHMAVIQGRGIIKVILDTLQRLAPELKTSIHTNPENALAYLRQQQRQAVDKSKFLQLWHVQQETMLLGGQTLKVVRRPQWSYQSDTAKSQFYLIEGETLVCSISGRLEAKDVTRQIELSEELEEVNGYPFTFVISDLSQVEWIDRKGRSLTQNYVKHAPYHPDHHLMIFPRFLRGLAKIFRSFLFSKQQDRTSFVSSLDTALSQIYVSQKPAPMPLTRVQQEIDYLQQQVSAYQQAEAVLVHRLGRVILPVEVEGEEMLPEGNLSLPDNSPLAGLYNVVEMVHQDLDELLAEREQRLAELTQLIDTANAPIFGVDTAGLINEWNQQVAQTSGYSKQEVLGQNLVEDYITQDYKQSVQQVLDQALLGSETDNYQVPLTTKDGRQVVILLNATTRRDTQGQVIGVVGVGQDITELNRYRQELEHIVDQRTAELRQALDDQIELTGELNQARQTAETAQLETEEANQAKSRFLSRTSHEIRTPMHGVIGSLDLLQLDSR